MSESTRVVLIGGPGNGLVAAQILEDMKSAGHAIELVGFLNDSLPVGELIDQWPVLGNSGQWRDMASEIRFVFCILSVGKMAERVNRIGSLGIPNERLATLVHPTAVIARTCRIGPGSVIAAHVTCQPGSSIGKNCVVRAGANVGHDVQVADHIDIGPNTTLCGYARIGEGAHIAANAVVRDNLMVGKLAVIGAGGVLLKDAAEGTTWLGNPARRVC